MVTLIVFPLKNFTRSYVCNLPLSYNFHSIYLITFHLLLILLCILFVNYNSGKNIQCSLSKNQSIWYILTKTGINFTPGIYFSFFFLENWFHSYTVIIYFLLLRRIDYSFLGNVINCYNYGTNRLHDTKVYKTEKRVIDERRNSIVHRRFLVVNSFWKPINILAALAQRVHTKRNEYWLSKRRKH